MNRLATTSVNKGFFSNVSLGWKIMLDESVLLELGMEESQILPFRKKVIIVFLEQLPWCESLKVKKKVFYKYVYDGNFPFL